MLMSRWLPVSPWEEMAQFRREMNRLFDTFAQGWPTLAAAYPALNIWEDEEALYAEAELPGMELDELEIYVTGNDQLTIKGERKRSTDNNWTWHRQERGFGSFTRVVTLPLPVDADKIEAKFKNGVLTIRMPKTEAAKPRKITVTAN
ncbi:MAG: molecular chaperone Hsp20 [Gemmatales bacterium]|nr:MAG: molecular chaperone Hsp20 [Gemmatales bacterium]